MTEERIEELHTEAFKLFLEAVIKTGVVDLRPLIRTVAAESRKEGIEEMLKAAKKRDPWKTGLDEEAERLKE